LEVAMNAVSATRFRAELYRYLDEVITTGQSVEVVLRGRKVRIVAVDAPTRLAAMEARADYIVGDPDDLVRPTFDETAWRKASDKAFAKRRTR
jgi:antitoxin (DNA-binding transcriptional repressor) of toxin-antitoxin stability system